MDLKKRIGRNLRFLRQNKMLSREKLAKKAKTSAIGIQHIEMGKRWPRPENIKALTKALGVDWEALFSCHLPGIEECVKLSPQKKAISKERSLTGSM